MRFFLIILSVACWIPCVIYSQQETRGNSKTEAQIDSINALAETLFQKSKYSAARELLQLSLSEAMKIGYKKGEGAANISLGNIAYATRNFVAAEQFGKQALDIFKQPPQDRLLAESYVIWARAV